MWRFLFLQIILNLINYILRNPYARKAAGIGCLAVLAIWVGSTVFGAMVAAASELLLAFADWSRSAPDGGLIAAGLGVAMVVGALCIGLVVHKPSRDRLVERLRRSVSSCRQRWVGKRRLGAPLRDDADDLGVRIRLLAESHISNDAPPISQPTPSEDASLLDQIVIYES